MSSMRAFRLVLAVVIAVLVLRAVPAYSSHEGVLISALAISPANYQRQVLDFTFSRHCHCSCPITRQDGGGLLTSEDPLCGRKPVMRPERSHGLSLLEA